MKHLRHEMTIINGLSMGSIMSQDEQYRYLLSRTWDTTKQKVMFVGLNPSTANAYKNDHTTTKLIEFAKRWGYGGFELCNLFAFRATKPTDMFNAAAPEGVDNDAVLMDAAKTCEKIVFCWGINGYYKNQDKHVIRMFPEAQCFGHTVNGYPLHPLTLSYDTTLQPFIKSE